MISDEKLPKEERIAKTGDFKRAYTKGASFKQGALIVYRVANGLDRNRLGLSISARNIKRANRRNAIKRILREIYRKSKKHLAPGFDIVLVVRRDNKASEYENMKKLFEKLTKEAGLIK